MDRTASGIIYGGSELNYPATELNNSVQLHDPTEAPFHFHEAVDHPELADHFDPVPEPEPVQFKISVSRAELPQAIHALEALTPRLKELSLAASSPNDMQQTGIALQDLTAAFQKDLQCAEPACDKANSEFP